MVAEATARELRTISLAEALELTVLIARKDLRRHPRVAARWLLRYLEEHDDPTIHEAVVVAACLAALHDCEDEAVTTLRRMASVVDKDGRRER